MGTAQVRPCLPTSILPCCNKAVKNLFATYFVSLLVTNFSDDQRAVGREPTLLLSRHDIRQAARSRAAIAFLEHDPEKWTPVFRKDHAQTNEPVLCAAAFSFRGAFESCLQHRDRQMLKQRR